MTTDEPKPNWPKLIQLGAAASQFGAIVAGGVLMGWWLDERFGWTPWATVAGLLGGSVAAFRVLYFVAKKMTEDGRGQAKDSEPPPGRRD